MQNQRAAIYRGEGMEQDQALNDPTLQLIVEHIDNGLQWYEQTVAAYETQ